MIVRGEPWRDRMQRRAPQEIARYGVVVVLAALAVASLLVPLHLDGLRLAIGVTMVVILAAVLITAPAEMRRRGELERANQRLRDEIAERARVEAELRRKEEFLSEVQRLSRTASWVAPIPRDPKPVAGENFRYVGLGQSNLSWTWDIVHPDDRERVKKIITAAIDERIGYELDHRIVDPAGSIRILHVRGQPVVDASGTVTEYIGTSTDVTKRRAAEAELRKSEQRYRNIFEFAGVAIVEQDFTGVMAVLDDISARESDVPRYLDEHPEVASKTLELVRVTDANQAAARLFAAGSPSEFLNAVSALTTPEIAAAWRIQLRAIAEGKRIVETEVSLTNLRSEKVSALVTIVLPAQLSGYESVLVTVVDLTERKRAEQALRESEAHYRALIELSPQMVWTTTAEGSVISENQWWYEYTGVRDPAAQGFEPIHPEHRRRMRKSWRETLASGREWIEEAPLRRADGQYRWHLLRGRPERDADGQIVRWVGVAIDIHDRREAEVALRESEERYRALIEVSPQVIWMAGADGSNMYFNQWWYDYTGLTQAESEGFAWGEVVHPEYRDRIIDSWRRHMESGNEWTMEGPLRRAADGQYRWHLARGLPIRDADGRIVRWIGVVFDIHDRREAEESLRRSEAWLSEGQRLSRTGSWAMNVETGQVVYASKEFLRIIGFDEGDGIPSTEVVLGRVHPDDRPGAIEDLERGLVAKTDYAAERRLTLPDGTIRHIHYVVHPASDAAGNVVELIGTVMDVTERKRSEEALRQTQAALTHVTRVATVGEVSASIAHELNQPLGAIANNANASLGLLSSAKVDLDEVRGALADIVGDAERASAIIERVRALARRSVPERVPVQLADLVREVVTLTGAESVTRRVAIRIDVADDLPRVLGDRVELQQVLLNLVVNGMDAMSGVEPSDRRLEIRGVPDQLDRHPAVRISVEDRGVGLRSEHADQLFEPFYTTKAHGMGLGLAISRSIIEAHGGRLWAEVNPGPGATFSFALPAAAAA
jgi:PAS domain S-box-containing protein